MRGPIPPLLRYNATLTIDARGPRLREGDVVLSHEPPITNYITGVP
jgi:hypothetical protein